VRYEARDVLQHVGVFDCFGCCFAPRERGMAGYEYAGYGHGVEAFGAESANDDGAGVAYVGFGHFCGG